MFGNVAVQTVFLKNLIFFKNNFFMFSDCFDMLMFKIFFLKKHFDVFLSKKYFESLSLPQFQTNLFLIGCININKFFYIYK